MRVCRTALGLLLLILAAVSGCGSRAERVEVEGTLRRHGQPLADVLVTFLPDPDSGNQGVRAAGRTDAQGRFCLRGEDQRDGAAAGWYRVVLEDLTVYAAPRAADGTLLKKPPARFPARYGDPLQTPLRREVRPEARTVELDVSDKP